MLFYKKNPSPSPEPLAELRLLDGMEAIIRLGARCCDAVLVHRPDSTSAAPSPSGQRNIRQSGNPAHLVGEAIGRTAAGMRCLTILHPDARDQLAGAVATAERYHLPLVLIYFCDDTNPADLLPERETFVHLHAGSVQQAIDLTLIAIKTAESALLPALVSVDARAAGAQAMQPVHLPEKGKIEHFAGNAGDEIPSPVHAQHMLFGDKRRRIPQWLDPDHPLGLGLQPDDALATRIAPARNIFFDAHLQEVIDTAAQEFRRSFGREFLPVKGENSDKAELLLLTLGALPDQALAAAGRLLPAEKKRLGFLHLVQLSPFPSGPLSHFLSKKRGITLLEQGVPSAALANSVRATLLRMLENGRRRKGLPWPGHAGSSGEPAEFFHGSLNEKLTSAGLRAMIANMLSGEKHRFFLTTLPSAAEIRIPALQARQQEIQRYYPRLEELILPPSEEQEPTDSEETRLYFYRSPGSAAEERVRFLAGALFEIISRQTRFTALPSSGRETLCITLGADQGPAVPAGLITDPEQLEVADPQATRPDFILLNSTMQGEALWQSLPEPWRGWIAEHNAHLFSIDARTKAGELSILCRPEELVEDILVGGLISVFPDLSPARREALREHYSSLIRENHANEIVRNERLSAFQYGTDNTLEITWHDFKAVPRTPFVEPRIPWTVRQVEKSDKSVFDLEHFYATTGYLYATGQQHKQLIDPFAAVSAVPARAGTAQKSSRPLLNLIRENLHNPDMDWFACAGAGLHATVNAIPELFETALKAGEQQGHAFIHLPRLLPHITKQAYKLFLEDSLHRYTDAGTLLQEAAEAVLKKLAPSDSQKQDILSELDVLTHLLQPLVIVRTERFFDNLHKQKKGSGLVLCVAINPEQAGDPAECLMRCPENTVELVERTPELEEAYLRGWEFLQHLPETSLDLLHELATAEESPLIYLFNRKVRNAMPFGVPSHAPGKALFMLAAAVEAVWLPRYQKVATTLRDLRSQLEQKIQDTLSTAARINDFEAFSSRLAELNGESLNAEELLRLAGEEHGRDKPDPAHIRALTDVRNALSSLLDEYERGANGDGRARAAVVFDLPSLRGHLPGIFPQNGFSFPWIDASEGHAAGMADGILSSLTELNLQTIRLMRKAKRLLAGKEAKDADIAPHELSDEERSYCPPVLFITDGERSTLLPGEPANRHVPIKVVYLNTNPFSAPESATFDIEQQHMPADELNHVDEPALHALQYRNCFVLQSTTGTPEHLFAGLLSGLDYPGPALLHILAPHFKGQYLDSAQCAYVAEHAVHSRSFPLFVFDPRTSENWGECLSLAGNPESRDDADWPEREVVFTLASGALRPHKQADTFADWVLNLSAWRHQFRILSKEDWDSSLTFLSEYLALPAPERVGRTPYIQFPDHRGSIQRAVVSREVVALCRDRLRLWNTLKEFEALERLPEQEIRRRVDELLQQEKAELEQRISADYEHRLAHLQQEHERIYHDKLRRKLLEMSGFAGDSETLRQTLKSFLS